MPYPNDSIKVIYTSNLLYYLSIDSIQKLLESCFRVLKKGAHIHISVADNDMEIGKRTYDNDLPLHKTRLDYHMIHGMLMKAGFCDIRKLKFRKTHLLVPLIFDRVPDRSMYVEARKP